MGATGLDGGIAWMASAMDAQQAKLENAAHNLANVSTDGFRRVKTTLSLSGEHVVARALRDGAQGAIRQTGRPFNLALIGPGAFLVSDGARIARTRSGAFERDRDGYLVDSRGRKLLGEHGVIRVDEHGTFGSDGSVRRGESVLARIDLPRGTTVRAGALEETNVDAVGEMVEILGAQRAFETSAKTLAALDQVRAKDAGESAKVSG